MALNNNLNNGTVPLTPSFGGTGVANTGTFTIGGNTAFSGAFTFTGIITGNTTVTFPTSGTLATTASASGIVDVGTAGQIAYYPASTAEVAGLTTVPVTAGGTGVATMTTAYAPVAAGTTATGALQVCSTGLSTSGFVLTSTGASSLPTFQALPAGGIVWANISGTTQAAAVNTGYVVGNVSQTTITLPATAAVGSVVQIQGKGAAGWILAANTGQVIQVGQTASSATGSVTSAAAYDAIQVVCVTADTTWTTSYVLSSGVTVA